MTQANLANCLSLFNSSSSNRAPGNCASALLSAVQKSFHALVLRPESESRSIDSCQPIPTTLKYHYSSTLLSARRLPDKAESMGKGLYVLGGLSSMRASVYGYTNAYYAWFIFSQVGSVRRMRK